MADDGDDGLVVAGTEPRKYTHCHHQLSWSQLMDRPTFPDQVEIHSVGIGQCHRVSAGAEGLVIN